MFLMNEHLHQRIADLEAQLAEAKARAARVEGERDQAWKEVERLVGTLNTYTDTGAGIFREIGEIAEKALGHPIEAGHTAAYAAEQMAERIAELAGPSAGEAIPVSILYTNWKGETAVRTIIPHTIRYAATEWHPEPQWLIEAWCFDRQAMRSFALLGFGGRDVSEGEVGQ